MGDRQTDFAAFVAARLPSTPMTAKLVRVVDGYRVVFDNVPQGQEAHYANRHFGPKHRKMAQAYLNDRYLSYLGV